MLSHDGFREAVGKVPSHGTWRHAELMHGLIRWLQPGSIVEVGSAHGFSTCWLARAAQENNADLKADTRVTVIDDYSLFPDAYMMLWHNVGMCQVGDVIQVAVGNSRSVEWPSRVDFAYVDADHSFEGCKYDVEKAISLGAKCVCLHDTQNWWGPRQYVEEAFPEGWTEISVGFDQGFTVMMKQPVKAPCYFTQERFPSGALEPITGPRD